jgi:SAM-dependent methyltransferase
VTRQVKRIQRSPADESIMTKHRPDLGKPQPFAHYDSRKYAMHDVVDGYRGWSEVYDERMDDRLDLDLFACVPLLDALDGQRVVDLACGTGRIGSWLKGRGASPTGVDLSPDMLERARAREVYDALLERDIGNTRLDAASFDGATSSMAFCHLEALEPTYREVSRLLRPGGWFALVDYHPSFLIAGVPSHYDDPETGEPMAVQDHLHGMSEHFRLAAEAGLTLVQFEERWIDESWVDERGSYAKWLGWPITFLMVFASNGS